MISRRELLHGLLLAGGASLLPFGRRGWALAAPDPTSRHMVMILMRGAVDGLSIVTPYREQNYYAARPGIAIAPPGQTDGLIDLNGYFGLNPALAPLMPYWQDRSLAFIQASGSPSETRSHFEAQDIIETALLNSAAANQGWMNGLAQLLPDNHSPTRALSFGNTLPKIFQGQYNVSTIPTGGKGGPMESPEMQKQLAQLYGGRPELNGIYQQGIASRQSLLNDMTTGGPDLEKEMVVANRGAPGADAFVNECTKAGDVIRRDPTVQLLFMDVGGWDTHVGQGNVKGQLSNKLQRLGVGIAALASSLGPEYKNTTIMIMSEFGRTVAQNGNGGTDHGHGNVAWVLGGAVRGGKVYGNWPGLNPNQLYAGRDLAVTTDFRSVIGAVAGNQFGLNQETLRRIIPNYQPDSNLNGLVG